MRALWNLWGWIFWRHWHAFRNRASRWDWYHWLHNAIRDTQDPLVQHPIRYRLSYFLHWGFGNECPHCGYDSWTEHDDLFVCRESGGPDYEGYSWWRGDQTCARCGQVNEYADST